jgi:titin
VLQISEDGVSWRDFSGNHTSNEVLRVNGLRSAKYYWFRVRADNGGTLDQDTNYMSLYWAVIGIETPESAVPDPPSNFTRSSVSSFGFSLSWLLPADDGGSALTNFTVEVSRNDGLSWQSVKNGVSTSNSLAVTGAAPGTTYLIRIAAVNAVGHSEYLTGSVTTLVVPASVPKNLVYTNLTESSVSLGWGLPESNGGSAITDYRVEVSSNGANSWTVIPHTASNSLGFNVSNLLPGRTYQFRVSAVTAAGIGAASNVITVTTLGAVGPNAPATLLVSGVKTNTASISWSGVVATQKVSNYLVDVSTDGSTWISVSKRVSTSTSLALSGLRLGTTYQVRVAAVNSVGTGSYVYGSFTTLATVSTAPTALVSSNVSSSGFTLNWNAPTSNGGAAITDYLVEVNGGGFSWAPINHDVTGDTSITVSGLNPGMKYTVRVKAVNRVGISKSSTSLYVTTLATAPGTVTGLTVKSVSATGAVITWTAPNIGGSRISDYLAEVSTDNGQTWKAVVKSASSSTTLTLKGLKTKTSYLIRVSAKNSVGYGSVSQGLALTTP